MKVTTKGPLVDKDQLVRPFDVFSSGRLMALYDFNTFTKRDRLGAIEILSFINHLRGYGDEGKDIWGG